MIDADLASRAAALLSTAAAELVEGEHLAMVTDPQKGRAVVTQAERLIVLGGDVEALGRALAVIARRAEGGGE